MQCVSFVVKVVMWYKVKRIHHTGGDLLHVELQIRGQKEIIQAVHSGHMSRAKCQEQNDQCDNKVCIHVYGGRGGGRGGGHQ